MREYIRMHAPGASFLLTLVTWDRKPILTVGRHVARLRAACSHVRRRHPFTLWAVVNLPDLLHVMIELPDGDSDFSTRMSLIKGRSSRSIAAAEIAEPPASRSRKRRRERSVWQRRFWEHTIRDESDFAAHMDYVHYNPVKHG